MGVKIASWQEELLTQLEAGGIAAELITCGNLELLEFKEQKQLVLNLISVGQPVSEEALLHSQQAYMNLQKQYLQENIQLIQLWEDIWFNRPLQVLSRIRGLLGLNKKIHGRKTKLLNITQPEADVFFQQYHLQGSAKARHRYALVADGEVVAMATFSAKRRMTSRGTDHNSVELIRFATIDGVTVQGGLSKLIRHLIKTVEPNDVMTYADLDWSYGKGYTKLGFELAAQTSPAFIWLHLPAMTRYFTHRLPVELDTQLMTEEELPVYLQSLQYVRIFNTGNLKYILYL